MSSGETKTKNRQKDKFAVMQLLCRLSTQVRRGGLSRGKTVKSQIEEGIYSLKSAFQKQTNSAWNIRNSECFKSVTGFMYTEESFLEPNLLKDAK